MVATTPTEVLAVLGAEVVFVHQLEELQRLTKDSLVVQVVQTITAVLVVVQVLLAETISTELVALVYLPQSPEQQ